ncbi:hypothetical protein J2Y38_003188 [Flavobacterium sp. 2755]|uniref:T9SS-dependent choice-of-anchor J family protein n=1 Tax=Flavobacterium sp. 2755 TaxID=2817765 RepID=UPI00285F4DD0|nr:choice-of-anchor J domain-containing protein [Flavobacterium sp. 2755]MDR6762970.1 hypothetical protein [Flavobacterium sp. 2755]
MQKTTFIVLFSFFNFLFTHANHKTESNFADANFDVTVSLTGEVLVEYHDYNVYKTNQWLFEYGPQGFKPGQGKVITVSGTGINFYRFTLTNPLIGYDFRVRQQYLLDDLSGFAWTDWSQIKTIFATSDKVFSVGYSTNFNDKSVTNLEWRGLIYKNSSSDAGISISNYDNHSASNEAGSAVFMSNYNYQEGSHVAFVSPKFNDIATNRKIKFWTNNYGPSGELLIGTMTNPNDLSTFHLLAPAEVKTGSGWQQHTIYFNNYKSNDEYIVFLFKSKYYGANSPSVRLDDFSYETAANCYDQSNFAVTDIKENSIKISFDSQNQNNFEVSLTNVVKHTTETFNIQSSPFVLNNLVGNTDYEVKVRANCIDDLFSNWTQTISFKTPCTVISGSYSTSFEVAKYVDPCWSIIANNCLVQTNLENTGWNSQPAPKTGQTAIAFAKFVSKLNVDKAYLITPYIADLDADKRIKFSLLAYSGEDTYNNSSLTIGTMSDPKDQTTFIPLKNILPSEMNELSNPNKLSLWKEHTIYLDNYLKSNNHHYIAIRYNNETNSNFSIDDFIYEKAPSCVEPINPVTVDFDYDFATVKWESYKPASEWQVEYGPKGFVHGNGILVNASSSTITLTQSLLDATEYDFYVRAKCGAGYSDWSDKGYFRTKCLGITAGFNDDFENTIFDKNGCWTRITPYFNLRYYQKSSFIKVNTATSGGPGTVHSGSNSILLTNQLDVVYPPGPGEKTDRVVLVSPRLKDFDNYKKINFWMFTSTQINDSPVELIIGTLSDPEDYTTFKAYQTIKISNADKSKWLNYEVDFSNYFGTDKFIGFKQSITNQRLTGFFIDDFAYSENDCPRPSNLGARQSGEMSAALDWKDNNVKKQSYSWDIEYGLKGFAEGTGTVISVKTNPFNVEGLNAGIYEYRVRAYCEENMAGKWSDKYAFKIGCTKSAPFDENFDSYKPNFFEIPNFCWTRSEPIYSQLSEYSVYNINSTPYVFYLQNKEADAYLISPYLEDFDSNKKIKFWLNYQPNSNSGDLVIGTIKNPLDLSTFEPYKTITIQELKDLPKYGKEFDIDFSEYKGENKHIMFKHLDDPAQSSVSNTVLIDDIHYGEAFSCYEPINIVFSDNSSNSVQINWTSKNKVPQNVKVEYGSRGFIPGTGTILNANSNGIKVSNLQTVNAYDFYFTTTCSDGNSIVVGPRKMETTSEIKTVPWLEKFDNLSSYGANIVPDGFKLLKGNVILENKSVASTYYFSPEYMRSGFDDTNYLYLKSSQLQVFSPMFSLVAGTTYKFSLKARSSYEFHTQGIGVTAGRGQNIYNMDTTLGAIGKRMTEYNYNDYIYYFTPIISGDYSFLLSSSEFSGTDFITDNLELKEGYTNTVNGNVEVTKYNFDTVSDAVILEGSSDNSSKVEIDPLNSDNKVVILRGNGRGEWKNPPSTTKKISAPDDVVWESNPSSISKINMKLDAKNTSSLFMRFDLRQTFVNSNKESMFRVVINGNVFGDVIQPSTSSSDTYETYLFDLTPYVGSDIRISLQHIGKSDSGDNAFVDNLIFNQTATLAVKENEYQNFKYYPNPVESVLNIEGNSIISNVEIYNLNGQLLSSKKYSDSKVVIDFKHYVTGLYLIVLTKDDKKESFKVMKK